MAEPQPAECDWPAAAMTVERVVEEPNIAHYYHNQQLTKEGYLIPFCMLVRA